LDNEIVLGPQKVRLLAYVDKLEYPSMDEVDIEQHALLGVHAGAPDRVLEANLEDTTSKNWEKSVSAWPYVSWSCNQLSAEGHCIVLPLLNGQGNEVGVTVVFGNSVGLNVIDVRDVVVQFGFRSTEGRKVDDQTGARDNSGRTRGRWSCVDMEIRHGEFD